MTERTIWACPVCREPLVLLDSEACCQANHRFDRARQGYYNLLLAHHKSSADPGDSRDMMLSRRSFLNQGFYAPLAKGLSEWLELKSTDLEKPVRLLDSGCGEGYYLGRLMEMAGDSDLQLQGLDISRDALKLAARSYPNIQWVVASGFRLPVLNESLDVVLRVFAPGDDSEVLRVLNEQGEFWRVAPGPNHLQELKTQLYEDFTPHPQPSNPEGFDLAQQERLEYSMDIPDQQTLHDLLGMTPFVWQAQEQRRNELLATPKLLVTADFLLQRFIPSP